MILDSTHNFNITSIPEPLHDMLGMLKETNFATIPEGKYEVQGDDIFYVVQEYESLSRDTVQAEIHKKYCDIQFMYSGKEAIGWSFWQDSCDLSSYDALNDIALFSPLENESVLLMESGMFVFFAPFEIHRPRLEYQVGRKTSVKKVVVKINANLL